MTNNAEREAFEKMAESKGWNIGFVEVEDGVMYWDEKTQRGWEAWQARAQASGVPDGWTIVRQDSPIFPVRIQAPNGDDWFPSYDSAAARLAMALISAAPISPKPASVPVERLEELRKLCVRKSTVYGSGAYQEFADSLSELIAEYRG